MKDVMILTGAGQIGLAIARRMGSGKKIIAADKSLKNAEATAKTLVEAGFDAEATETDISSRSSVLELIAKAQSFGQIKMLVNAAGYRRAKRPSKLFRKLTFTARRCCLKRSAKLLRTAAQRRLTFTENSARNNDKNRCRTGRKIL